MTETTAATETAPVPTVADLTELHSAYGGPIEFDDADRKTYKQDTCQFGTPLGMHLSLEAHRAQAVEVIASRGRSLPKPRPRRRHGNANPRRASRTHPARSASPPTSPRAFTARTAAAARPRDLTAHLGTASFRTGPGGHRRVADNAARTLLASLAHRRSGLGLPQAA